MDARLQWCHNGISQNGLLCSHLLKKSRWLLAVVMSGSQNDANPLGMREHDASHQLYFTIKLPVFAKNYLISIKYLHFCNRHDTNNVDITVAEYTNILSSQTYTYLSKFTLIVLVDGFMGGSASPLFKLRFSRYINRSKLLQTKLPPEHTPILVGGQASYGKCYQAWASQCPVHSPASPINHSYIACFRGHRSQGKQLQWSPSSWLSERLPFGENPPTAKASQALFHKRSSNFTSKGLLETLPADRKEGFVAHWGNWKILPTHMQADILSMCWILVYNWRKLLQSNFLVVESCNR